ncbi:hypothetical protein Ahy_B01g052024 isoform G [Arachis hypogaea]|uniref:Uncharacterized protein n=1 Tax=Arachis hypogaea TaxID=3818 RepID=A0A445ANE5_ARAHY|nr:hypothetical protein Ahy_B01g052024 isoform G [Arachis hypogaea]
MGKRGEHIVHLGRGGEGRGGFDMCGVQLAFTAAVRGCPRSLSSYCRRYPSQTPCSLSSSSLGAHPPSNSSCSRSSCHRRRRLVALSKGKRMELLCIKQWISGLLPTVSEFKLFKAVILFYYIEINQIIDS